MHFNFHFYFFFFCVKSFEVVPFEFPSRHAFLFTHENANIVDQLCEEFDVYFELNPSKAKDGKSSELMSQLMICGNDENIAKATKVMENIFLSIKVCLV